MTSSRGGKRDGAGRPQGTTKAGGLPTHVVRVSTEVTKEQCQALPDLMHLINLYEETMEEARSRGESLRTYEKLAKFLEEARELGF
jgi:hypothetical protein